MSLKSFAKVFMCTLAIASTALAETAPSASGNSEPTRVVRSRSGGSGSTDIITFGGTESDATTDKNKRGMLSTNPAPEKTEKKKVVVIRGRSGGSAMADRTEIDRTK